MQTTQFTKQTTVTFRHVLRTPRVNKDVRACVCGCQVGGSASLSWFLPAEVEKDLFIGFDVLLLGEWAGSWL